MAKDSDSFFDVSKLLHPAQAFSHPRDVIADTDLTLYEKRAILSSWASDACAVEAAPALREIRKGRVVPFDDIMDALRSLDNLTADATAGYEQPRARRFRGGGKLSGGGAALQ